MAQGDSSRRSDDVPKGPGEIHLAGLAEAIPMMEDGSVERRTGGRTKGAEHVDISSRIPQGIVKDLARAMSSRPEATFAISGLRPGLHLNLEDSEPLVHQRAPRLN